jgi:hypothetical protein
MARTPEEIAEPEVSDASDPMEGSGPLSVRCQTNPRDATRDAEAGSQPRATERHRITGIADSGATPEEIAEGRRIIEIMEPPGGYGTPADADAAIAMVRKIAEGLSLRSQCEIADLCAYQRGESMTWRLRNLDVLRLDGLVDDNGWPTDLGRAVAEVLARKAGAK